MYQEAGPGFKGGEFPGAGHCRKRPTESTKRFFVFFTVPPLKKDPMGVDANAL